MNFIVNLSRQRYTAPVTPVSVAGIGLLKHSHDESRGLFSAESAASLSVPPVLAARMGERKLRRFPQGVSGRPTRSSRRLRLVSGAVVFENHTPWRPLMALALTCASAPVLAVVDGTPTTLSTDVARHFGKRHDNVLRDIENLRAQLPADCLLNFEETEETRASPLNGAPISARAYRLTRDGFTLLAMGFTGKKALAFKLAYIDAFNRMEAELLKPLHDPERVALAQQMAQQATAQVYQSVFDAVMAGDPDWKSNRYLLRFGITAQGLQTETKTIERNAYVLPMQDFADAISNSITVDLECLSHIASTCMQRINYKVKNPGKGQKS